MAPGNSIDLRVSIVAASGSLRDSAARDEREDNTGTGTGHRSTQPGPKLTKWKGKAGMKQCTQGKIKLGIFVEQVR